jgi:hypothetical protein
VSKAIIGSLLALTLALPLAGCNKSPSSTETAAPAAAPAAMPEGMDGKAPHPMPATDAAPVDLSGIAKADGGKTVAEVFAEKDALAGKPVTVRGKVVKANSGIMGKNWIHVRDGSGSDGTNDLTVTTTTAQPNVGDTVLVTGPVSLNKDFGMGYQYDVIVEDAQVTVETTATL